MLPILTILTALGAADAAPVKSEPLSAPPVCVAPIGPEYYAIELFTTKNIPGTGLARGMTDVSTSGGSPFSVAVTTDGSYQYDVYLSLERVRAPRAGQFVAWAATSDLDQVQRIGALDENLRASGTVGWNQFLIIVTLEASDDETATVWSGPIAFRGMSRSGMMHTMVGHGALQQENCAAYGYRN